MRNAVWFGATQFDRQIRDGCIEVEVGIAAVQEVQKMLAQQFVLVHFGNASSFRPINLLELTSAWFRGTRAARQGGTVNPFERPVIEYAGAIEHLRVLYRAGFFSPRCQEAWPQPERTHAMNKPDSTVAKQIA